MSETRLFRTTRANWADARRRLEGDDGVSLAWMISTPASRSASSDLPPDVASRTLTPASRSPWLSKAMCSVAPPGSRCGRTIITITGCLPARTRLCNFGTGYPCPELPHTICPSLARGHLGAQDGLTGLPRCWLPSDRRAGLPSPSDRLNDALRLQNRQIAARICVAVSVRAVEKRPGSHQSLRPPPGIGARLSRRNAICTNPAMARFSISPNTPTRSPAAT